MNNEKTTTEAPLSMTFKVSYKGIEVLMTNRDIDAQVKPYLEKAQKAIDWALSNGFEVPAPRTFGVKKEKVFVEGVKCPKCGGRLEEKVSNAGKKFQKCENGKWNFTEKRVEGCDYVNFL